jgi:ABC-type transporter Mla MlaB component
MPMSFVHPIRLIGNDSERSLRLAVPEAWGKNPASVLRLHREPTGVVLIIGGPITRADTPELCERARVLLERSEAELVVCDVGALIAPDAVTVDALARLQLTALRLGRRVRLRDACGELQELLGLTGLSESLPLVAASGVEPMWQAEEREQRRGVEKEADPADPGA